MKRRGSSIKHPSDRIKVKHCGFIEHANHQSEADWHRFDHCEALHLAPSPEARARSAAPGKSAREAWRAGRRAARVAAAGGRGPPEDGRWTTRVELVLSQGRHHQVGALSKE